MQWIFSPKVFSLTSDQMLESCKITPLPIRPWQTVASLITRGWIISFIFHESLAVAVSFLINLCAIPKWCMNFAANVSDVVRNVLYPQGFHFPQCQSQPGVDSLTWGHKCVRVLAPNKQDSQIWRNAEGLRLPALRLHCVCWITWQHQYVMRFLHTLLPLWLSSSPLESNVFPCWTNNLLN